MQRATLILTLSRTTFKFCQNDLRDGFTAELPQSQDMMVLSIPPMPFYYGYQKCEVSQSCDLCWPLSDGPLSYVWAFSHMCTGTCNGYWQVSTN